MITDPRKWVQIADDLRDRIDTGRLKPFDRVSIAAEVRARRVDPGTVAKALKQLAGEGKVTSFPGHGYVVTGGDPQSGT